MYRVLVPAVLAAAATVKAQCPDGTPPPCRASARARVVPPPPAERGRRFLVLPFRNLSRSPENEWLVEGSTTMLADALGRWQEIAVVSDDRLYPALQRAGLQPGAVMDPTRVRRVAEETSGWTVVSGDVISTGGRLRVSARAVDVVSGRELVRASDDVAAGGDVRPAFERIGTRLLRAAGLDTAVVDLGAATTRSLDAYRAYLRGVALARRSQNRQAREALLESVRLDSTFALPWLELAATALFLNPLSVVDPRSAVHRYIARATELSAQLSPSRRDEVVALQELFQLHYTTGRQTLTRLAAADSSDPEVIGWLAFLEFVDPILVDVPGGRRPRGSMNRSVRLSRRVLELAPENHSAFVLPSFGYLVAGGAPPALMAGFPQEGPSFAAILRGGVRFFVPLYTDSIILVPAESLATWPADSVRAARRRALEQARSWSDRWLTVGRGEGEAWAVAGEISELQGDLARALSEYGVADSLGVEVGIVSARQRRVGVLGKLGRFDDAYAAARAQWDAGRLNAAMPFPTSDAEVFSWLFNLCLMRGEFARADTVMSRFTADVLRAANMTDTIIGGAMALPLLAGATIPPLWMVELPPAFRVEVQDSLWVHRDAIPAAGRVANALPVIKRLTVQAAARDSALAARVRAAPWFSGPP